MDNTRLVKIAIVAASAALVAVAQAGLLPGFEGIAQALAAFLGGYVVKAPGTK